MTDRPEAEAYIDQVYSTALTELFWRRQARADAREILQRVDGFDADLYFGRPSYAGAEPELPQGWIRFPKYPSRELLRRVGDSDLLRAEDGSVIAYRPEPTTRSD